MCLILTIHFTGSDSAHAAEICRAAGIPAYSRKWPLISNARKPLGVIQIPGPDGGCGCSFLADSATWSASTWDMIPQTLPRLASILRSIRQYAQNSFSFEAIWIGDAPIEECRVTIDELVHLAEQSKLRTKTKYRVQKA